MTDSTAPRDELPENADDSQRARRKSARREIRTTYLREVNRPNPSPRKKLKTAAALALLALIMAVIFMILVEVFSTR